MSDYTIEELIDEFKGSLDYTNVDRINQIRELTDKLKEKAYKRTKDNYTLDEFIEKVWNNRERMFQLLPDDKEAYLFVTSDNFNTLTDKTTLTNDGLLISIPQQTSRKSGTVIAECYDFKGHNMMSIINGGEKAETTGNKWFVDIRSYHADSKGDNNEYVALMELSEDTVLDIDKLSEMFKNISIEATLHFMKRHNDRVTSFDAIRLKECTDKLVLLNYNFAEYLEDYMLESEVVLSLIEKTEGSIDYVDTETIEYTIAKEALQKLYGYIPLAIKIAENGDGCVEYQPLPLFYDVKAGEVITADELNYKLPSINLDASYDVYTETREEVHDELDGDWSESFRETESTDEKLEWCFYEEDILKSIGFEILTFDKDYADELNFVDRYIKETEKELEIER